MKKEKNKIIDLIIISVIIVVALLISGCPIYECVSPAVWGPTNCGDLTADGESTCESRGSCGPSSNENCISDSSLNCPDGCEWRTCIWQEKTETTT